jgi:hypothetical protein
VCFACGIPYSIASFFGRTGTLIAVGVILDTMKQVEGHLLQKNYDGFMKKARCVCAARWMAHAANQSIPAHSSWRLYSWLFADKRK